MKNTASPQIFKPIYWAKKHPLRKTAPDSLSVQERQFFMIAEYWSVESTIIDSMRRHPDKEGYILINDEISVPVDIDSPSKLLEERFFFTEESVKEECIKLTKKEIEKIKSIVAFYDEDLTNLEDQISKEVF